MKPAKAGGRASKRIAKELERFREEAGSEFEINVVSPDSWLVTFMGAEGSLYEGEQFTLQIRFTEDYPMDSPEVTFVPPAPVHEHIYSNGHICLNILGDDWSPALTVRSICLSVQSMLSSAQVKIAPQDNDSYVRVKRSTPKNTRFAYHDDTV